MRYALGSKQFRVLYRVFLLRVIDLDLLSTDGDTTKLLGQFAAVLAGVSFLFTVPLILLGGTLPQAAIWQMEHLLITTTITIVGLFSVLSWDAMVPDRRDVLVLAPLPIRVATLFSSKLVAVGASLGLVIVSLNIFSGLIWPLLFSPSGSGLLGAVRSFIAYWLTMVLAALATFSFVLVMQGVAAQLVSRQQYLRLSAPLQVICFCTSVSLFFLEPSLSSNEALVSPANQRILSSFPSYWFLALFQQLNGSMSPGFALPAKLGWSALLLNGLFTSLTLLLFYFRTLGKLIEEPDIVPSAHHRVQMSANRYAAHTAILTFTLRTLLRSRQHRLITSFYLGVGAAAILAYVRLSLDGGTTASLQNVETHRVILCASLLLMCVAVGSIRTVFSIPISTSANWLFRLTELVPVPAYTAAVRYTLIAIGIAPALLVLTPALLFFLPIWLAFEYLAILVLFGVCLVEVSMSNFQKVPFSCSYLPGKANVQIAFWASVMLAIPLAYRAAILEQYVLGSPIKWLGLLLLLTIILMFARRRTRALADAAPRLEFEDHLPAEVFGLSLERS